MMNAKLPFTESAVLAWSFKFNHKSPSLILILNHGQNYEFILAKNITGKCDTRMCIYKKDEIFQFSRDTNKDLIHMKLMSDKKQNIQVCKVLNHLTMTNYEGIIVFIDN